jgi:hypothetical protein
MAREVDGVGVPAPGQSINLEAITDQTASPAPSVVPQEGSFMEVYVREAIKGTNHNYELVNGFVPYLGFSQDLVLATREIPIDDYIRIMCEQDPNKAEVFTAFGEDLHQDLPDKVVISGAGVITGTYGQGRSETIFKDLLKGAHSGIIEYLIDQSKKKFVLRPETFSFLFSDKEAMRNYLKVVEGKVYVELGERVTSNNHGQMVNIPLPDLMFAIGNLQKYAQTGANTIVGLKREYMHLQGIFQDLNLPQTSGIVSNVTINLSNDSGKELVEILFNNNPELRLE